MDWGLDLGHDYVDLNHDGIADVHHGVLDANHDGINDFLQNSHIDLDGDHIPDQFDSHVDINHDGVSDLHDGILDISHPVPRVDNLGMITANLPWPSPF